MVIAAGASAKSQQALGTVVMGGMIAVVVLALIMVPIFFVVVSRVFDRRAASPKPARAEAGATPQLGD
jgi:multidrug efflux pump